MHESILVSLHRRVVCKECQGLVRDEVELVQFSYILDQDDGKQGRLVKLFGQQDVGRWECSTMNKSLFTCTRVCVITPAAAYTLAGLAARRLS